MAVTSGKHAPWRLWLLIISWVLQCLFLGLELILIVNALLAITRNPAFYTSATIAGASMQLILITLTLALILTEIIKLSLHSLTPLLYTLTSFSKTTIWAAIILAASLLNAKNGTNYYTTTGNYGAITLTVALIVLFLAPTIHGFVTFLKFRGRRGTWNGVQRDEDGECEVKMVNEGRGEGFVLQSPPLGRKMGVEVRTVYA